MLATLATLNYAAIVAAAIAGMVVLFVWYLPPLFGGRWMAVVGAYAHLSHADLMSGQARAFGIALVAMLLNALLVSVLVHSLGVASLADALLLAVLLWLGLGATFSVWPVAFARQPWGLWAINNGAHLVLQLAMALIVTLWR